MSDSTTLPPNGATDLEKNIPSPQEEDNPSEIDHTAKAARDAPPDGGLRAWLVAAGATGALFCTLGFTNTFGIFQAYYIYNQLPEESPDKIAWIGSTQAFLMFAAGIVGGPLFDRYGAWIIRPAAGVYLFAIMMTSLCTKYWQFMLAQGVLTGLASGMTMYPCMSAVPQWFNKNRGAAMGLTIAGSSLGAVIFPILVTNLLTKSNIGFGWSIRIPAFVMLPILVFASFAVKDRLPPSKTAFFLWYSFKQPTYVLLIAAIFFGMIGMFVPLFLIPTFAIIKGMDATLASYLVAVVNGASIFGRIIPGMMADKYGRINILIIAGMSTAICCFCWPKADSTAGIIAFSTVFGFCSGAIVSAGSTALTSCVDHPKNTGTYLGMGMALASFAALIGPPVSGTLIDDSFNKVSYFAGAMTMCGAIMGIVAKSQHVAGMFGRA